MSQLGNLRYGRGVVKESSPSGYSGKIPVYFRLLFSLPIMGLFVQWLRPLYIISKGEDTRQLLAVLALAAAVLLLCGLFQLPSWVLFLAQFIVIALSWIFVCAEDQGPSWATNYLAEIKGDALLFFSGKISELSSESRLLILLAGWGMLVASVQHLALFRGSISLFSLVTLVYLIVLDKLTAIHTLQEIVISTGLILWLKGMCRLLVMRDTNPAQRGIPFARWGITALIVAAGVTGVSWLGGERYSPQPGSSISLMPMIGKLQRWAEGESLVQKGAVAAMTGYGSGEGELGAPLSKNNKPVFTAESSVPAYWRGESFTYYDGRRLSKSNDDFIPLNLASLTDKNSSLSVASEERVLLQQIKFAVPSAGGLPLFGAGRVVDVKAVELADGSRLGFVFSNTERDSFRLPSIRGEARVTGYTIESLLPEMDPKILRGLNGSDPAKIKDSYLQLPSSLPVRVRELAEEIMPPARTRYDAVVSVRDYLQNHYPYTLDTKIPPPGSDFVDDFLFEARKGYCVHFATAMVTLLRTADIPVRYVQGYGPGSAEKGSAPQRYVVTQADAHAWVEVYFPGAGWVPFDPTPGSAAAAGSALPGTSPAAFAAPPVASAPAALGAGALPARLRQGGPPQAPLAAAALLPAAAWRWRRSLVLLLAARSSRTAKPERLLAAAALAWQGLAARYGQPPPGMTGREYVASLHIEDARLREAVWQFVRQWETLAYSPVSMAVQSPATAPSSADSDSAAGFINVCLGLTLRLA
ncbi:MAG: transglutaminase-like domain-containing protein [Paenibacillus sp.]|nr:transglutaminase-like domain-containing protein [Paenibacillus sp.]